MRPIGNRARWLLNARVSRWACKATLEIGKRLDKFRGLEGAIAPAGRSLNEDAGFNEARDRFVRSLDTAPDEVGCALDREHWRAGQFPQEEIGRGSGSD